MNGNPLILSSVPSMEISSEHKHAYADAEPRDDGVKNVRPMQLGLVGRIIEYPR
jgi:hypothetical protein